MLGNLNVFATQQSDLLASLPIPAILIDPVGVIIATSSGARELLEAGDMDISEMTISDVLTPESAKRLFGVIEKKTDSSATLTLTFRSSETVRGLKMEVHTVMDGNKFMGVRLVGQTQESAIATAPATDTADS